MFGYLNCPNCNAPLSAGATYCAMCGRSLPPQQGGQQQQQYFSQGKENTAIASLVLGIVSLVFVLLWVIALPTAIIGLILGFYGRDSKGHGMAVAGIVCSLISLSIQVLILIFFMLLLSQVPL